MSVHVRAVFKDGSLGGLSSGGCFGFICNMRNLSDVLRCSNTKPPYFGVEDVQKIIYYIPSETFVEDSNGENERKLNKQEEIIVEKYYDILHTMGITKFIQKDKVTLEQILDPERGVALDITKYPGQFIVGIFEMFRNAVYHYPYIKEVVRLADSGVAPAAAFCLARVAHGINAPYADSLNPGILYKNMANFLTEEALAVGFKEYPHTLDTKTGYRGVFRLFTSFCKDDCLPHEVLAAITKKGRIAINRAIYPYDYASFLHRIGAKIPTATPATHVAYNEYFKCKSSPLPPDIFKQLEEFVLHGTEVKL